MSKERGSNPLTHLRLPNRWVQTTLYAPPRNKNILPPTQRGEGNQNCGYEVFHALKITHGVSAATKAMQVVPLLVPLKKQNILKQLFLLNI